MADEFEVIFSAMLVVAFAAICYLAGKGNMLELVPKILLERLEEINKKHGVWIRHKENCLYNKCSVCSYEHCREDNYCPNCGADMRRIEKR